MDVIAQHGTVLVVIAIIFGLYMTWGIGANDVANAMGTSVGSKAITVKQAVIIAAVCEFAGAFLAGSHVTRTIRRNIIDSGAVAERPELLVFGMLAALLAAAVWLMMATSRGWPVSTSHTIVGAIVGFAMVGIGHSAVAWGKVGQIVVSWVVSPLLGGVLARLQGLVPSRTSAFDANFLAPRRQHDSLRRRCDAKTLLSQPGSAL